MADVRVRSGDHQTRELPDKQGCSSVCVILPVLGRQTRSFHWPLALLTALTSARGVTHTTGTEDPRVLRNPHTELHLKTFSGWSTTSWR